jgi:hypothetical protein
MISAKSLMFVLELSIVGNFVCIASDCASPLFPKITLISSDLYCFFIDVFAMPPLPLVSSVFGRKKQLHTSEPVNVISLQVNGNRPLEMDQLFLEFFGDSGHSRTIGRYRRLMFPVKRSNFLVAVELARYKAN